MAAPSFSQMSKISLLFDGSGQDLQSPAVPMDPSTLEEIARENDRKINKLQALLEDSYRELRRLRGQEGHSRITKKSKASSKDPSASPTSSANSRRRQSRSRQWTPEERKLFNEAWAKHGPSEAWSLISAYIGTRSAKQVRLYARRQSKAASARLPPTSPVTPKIEKRAASRMPELLPQLEKPLVTIAEPMSPGSTSFVSAESPVDTENGLSSPLLESDEISDPMERSDLFLSSFGLDSASTNAANFFPAVLNNDWDSPLSESLVTVDSSSWMMDMAEEGRSGNLPFEASEYLLQST